MQLTRQRPHAPREFSVLLSRARKAGYVRLSVLLVEFGEAGAEGVESSEVSFVLCFLGGRAFFEVVEADGEGWDESEGGKVSKLC